MKKKTKGEKFGQRYNPLFIQVTRTTIRQTTKIKTTTLYISCSKKFHKNYDTQWECQGFFSSVSRI